MTDHHIDGAEDNKIYTCMMCSKTFNIYNSYWKHINKKKSACVSQEQCKEFVEEIKYKDSRIQYFEKKRREDKTKIETLAKEVEYLKQQTQSINDLVGSVNVMNETITEKLDDISDQKQIINVAYNNNNTNHTINANNTDDDEPLFNFKLAVPEKERMDHIPAEHMLKILNNKEFNDTMKDLIAAVYFHPKAPENWRWCVNDIDAQYGAIAYDFETNTISRQSTVKTINANVRYIMSQVVDIIDELRSRYKFNQNQFVNTNKLNGLYGCDLDPELMRGIRESAYVGRNFPKALWDRLDIDMVKIPYEHRIYLKAKKPTKAIKNTKNTNKKKKTKTVPSNTTTTTSPNTTPANTIPTNTILAIEQ